MREFIIDHVSSFLRSIESLDGNVDDLIIEPPATETELAGIEKVLERPLPIELRTFASNVSRRIAFRWNLPEDFKLPQPLRQIFAGGLEYDVSTIPDHEKGRAGWQAGCFSKADDPYDAVWHNKLGFHDVPNGDYLGFDSDGRIIYLSHDDGQGHGYVMASSFPDLLSRWVPLGCPGPEDWQWLPFVSGPISGILPASENAKHWLTVIRGRP
jgi:hypothetical protein